MISVIRSAVYKNFFGDHNPVSTINGFHEVLKTVKDASSILDVGCGDGLYYSDTRVDGVIATIKKKKLKIHSIDIDEGAVPICKKRIAENGLSNQVTAQAIDFMLITEKYDVVLFMESFPVIPRQLMKTFIAHSKNLTTHVKLYHNLVTEKSLFVDWFKPKIKYLTLVDFGLLTTVAEMEKECQEWHVKDYQVNKCLECTYADMHWILNLPGIHDTPITQYLVEVHH